MFLGIEVPKCDRPPPKFLLHDTPTEDMVEHEHSRHIFEVGDSPTSASCLIQQIYGEKALLWTQQFK